jgi:hypothetical protein
VALFDHADGALSEIGTVEGDFIVSSDAVVLMKEISAFSGMGSVVTGIEMSCSLNVAVLTRRKIQEPEWIVFL